MSFIFRFEYPRITEWWEGLNKSNALSVLILGKYFYGLFLIKKGGRRHWAVNYTSTQSFYYLIRSLINFVYFH